MYNQQKQGRHSNGVVNFRGRLQAGVVLKTAICEVGIYVSSSGPSSSGRAKSSVSASSLSSCSWFCTPARDSSLYSNQLQALSVSNKSLECRTVQNIKTTERPTVRCGERRSNHIGEPPFLCGFRTQEPEGRLPWTPGQKSRISPGMMYFNKSSGRLSKRTFRCQERRARRS